MSIRFIVDFFTITVDYTQSPAKMIDAGKYGLIGKNIKTGEDVNKKIFPPEEEKKDIVDVTLSLIEFLRDTTAENIFNLFEMHNLRPASVPEILAFGAKYPDKQTFYPIIALGEKWNMCLWIKVITDPGKMAVLRTLTTCETPKTKKWHRFIKFLATSK